MFRPWELNTDMTSIIQKDDININGKQCILCQKRFRIIYNFTNSKQCIISVLFFNYIK